MRHFHFPHDRGHDPTGIETQLHVRVTVLFIVDENPKAVREKLLGIVLKLTWILEAARGRIGVTDPSGPE